MGVDVLPEDVGSPPPRQPSLVAEYVFQPLGKLLAAVMWGVFVPIAALLGIATVIALVVVNVLIPYYAFADREPLYLLGLVGTLPPLVCLVAVAWGPVSDLVDDWLVRRLVD